MWDFKSELNLEQLLSDPSLQLIPLADVFTQNLKYDQSNATFGVRFQKALGIPAEGGLVDLKSAQPYILQWAFGELNNFTASAPLEQNMGVADFSYVEFQRLKDIHIDNHLVAIGF